MEFAQKNSEESCRGHGKSSLAGSCVDLSDAGSSRDVLVKREENSVSLGSLQEDELMPVKKMIKVEEGAEVKIEYDDNDEWSDCSEQNDGDGSPKYEGYERSLDGDD